MSTPTVSAASHQAPPVFPGPDPITAAVVHAWEQSRASPGGLSPAVDRRLAERIKARGVAAVGDFIYSVDGVGDVRRMRSVRAKGPARRPGPVYYGDAAWPDGPVKATRARAVVKVTPRR